MSTSLIHNLVRVGKITPAQAAGLMMLRREIAWRARWRWWNPLTWPRW